MWLARMASAHSGRLSMRYAHKNALKSEQEDLEYRIKKYYDPSVVEYKKSVKDARRELRQRQRDVDEAFDVYTLNMDKVYLQMCVPERQIVSCLGLYEFVGYRPDKDAECPYVLDEISPTHETRHKFVSFDELKDGIEKYKDYNGVTDEERAEIDEVLRTICPMPIIASVKVTVSKKGKKRDKRKATDASPLFSDNNENRYRFGVCFLFFLHIKSKKWRIKIHEKKICCRMRCGCIITCCADECFCG